MYSSTLLRTVTSVPLPGSEGWIFSLAPFRASRSNARLYVAAIFSFSFGGFMAFVSVGGVWLDWLHPHPGWLPALAFCVVSTAIFLWLGDLSLSLILFWVPEYDQALVEGGLARTVIRPPKWARSGWFYGRTLLFQVPVARFRTDPLFPWSSLDLRFWYRPASLSTEAGALRLELKPRDSLLRPHGMFAQAVPLDAGREILKRARGGGARVVMDREAEQVLTKS